METLRTIANWFAGREGIERHLNTLATVFVVVSLAISYGYVERQRSHADALHAIEAIASLFQAPTYYSQGATQAANYASSEARYINLFLNSDAAGRSGVTIPMRRAWSLLRAADGLNRLAQKGEEEPAIADVPYGRTVLALYPPLGDHVKKGDGPDRFANPHGALVSRMMKLVAQEGAACVLSFAKSHPDYVDVLDETVGHHDSRTEE